MNLWFRQAAPGCVEVGAVEQERAAVMAQIACRIALKKGAAHLTVDSAPFALCESERQRMSAVSVPGFRVQYSR